MQTTTNHDYETNLKSQAKKSKNTQSHAERQTNYQDASNAMHGKQAYTNSALTRH